MNRLNLFDQKIYDLTMEIVNGNTRLSRYWGDITPIFNWMLDLKLCLMNEGMSDFDAILSIIEDAVKSYNRLEQSSISPENYARQLTKDDVLKSLPSSAPHKGNASDNDLRDGDKAYFIVKACYKGFYVVFGPSGKKKYTLSSKSAPYLRSGDRVRCRIKQNGASFILIYDDPKLDQERVSKILPYVKPRQSKSSTINKTSTTTVRNKPIRIGDQPLRASLISVSGKKNVKTENSFRRSTNTVVEGRQVDADDYHKWNAIYGDSDYHRIAEKKVCRCCGDEFKSRQGVRIDSTQVYFCYRCWKHIKETPVGTPKIISTPMGGQPGTRKRRKSNS